MMFQPSPDSNDHFETFHTAHITSTITSSITVYQWEYMARLFLLSHLEPHGNHGSHALTRQSRVTRRAPQIHPQLPLHYPRLAHLLPAYRARPERPRLSLLEQPFVSALVAHAVPARHDAHHGAAAKAHEALLEPLIVLLLLLILLLLLFLLLLLL
jgi:hypothetical protein